MCKFIKSRRGKHIKQNINLINHYPKEDQEPYKNKILSFLNSTNPNLLLGNGASELIDLTIRLFNSNKTSKKYFVSETQYMEYERSCILYNYKKTNSIEDADIICIINPCNPTGLYYTTQEIFKIISNCKENSIIIIDESMLFWIGKNFREKSMVKEQDFIQELLSKKNIKLFIIHSYTKIFSCTGIRFGTILCPDKKTYNHIKHFQNPWNCNILALEYISKCVDDEEYLNVTWNTTKILRNNQKELINKYFPEWKIHGESFLSWFWIEMPNEEIAEKIYLCSKQSYMPVRWGKIGYNKNNCIRVAVRKMENFDKLLKIWIENIDYLNNNCNNNFKCILKTVDIDNLLTHEIVYEESSNLLYNYLLSLNGEKTIPSIIVDDKTNIIIDGHHRLNVLKKLGVKEIQVTAIDYLEQNNIIVNPEDLSITKEIVIQHGLIRNNFKPKTTQHMLCINNKLLPIIILSKIVTINSQL